MGIADVITIFKGFVAHGESPVVDEPATAQSLMDQIFLFFIWVDPKFNTFLLEFCSSFCTFISY